MSTFFLHENLAKQLLLFPEEKYFSQYQQDQFVNQNFFKNRKDGVFIDIGAHDGVTISNTYFFEKQLSWKGICVEPIPIVFNSLQKNRSCVCIQGCISDFEGESGFLYLENFDSYSGLIDKYDPLHKELIELKIKNQQGTGYVIQVKTFLLNNILNDHQIFHVDFLSLDTEGGEFNILKSIDYDRFFIDIITVENNYYSPEIRQFLESKNYEFVIRLRCDEIYKKKTIKKNQTDKT